MGSREKLVQRFRSKPSDFTWAEMKSLLEGFGYKEEQGSGSRVKFTKEGLPRILLHKPHPASIVKQYAVKAVHKTLSDENLI